MSKSEDCIPSFVYDAPIAASGILQDLRQSIFTPQNCSLDRVISRGTSTIETRVLEGGQVVIVPDIPRAPRDKYEAVRRGDFELTPYVPLSHKSGDMQYEFLDLQRRERSIVTASAFLIEVDTRDLVDKNKQFSHIWNCALAIETVGLHIAIYTGQASLIGLVPLSA